MRIQPSQNNNTNFQGLNVCTSFKLSRRVNRDLIFNNPAIKECADKFEVLIKKESSHKNRFAHEYGSFIVGMFGIVSGVYTGLLAMAGALSGVVPAICFLTTALATVKGTIGKQRLNTYSLQVGKEVTNGLLGKKLQSPITPKYMIEELEDSPWRHRMNIDPMDDIVNVALMKDCQNFQNILAPEMKENLLFEPKDFIKLLKNHDIKHYYSNSECFNYKMPNSNDTLLSKFFDIVPTEENKNDYNKVIKILKNMKDVDYNQMDSNGVSILEKIINSENVETLDLVKDKTLGYSNAIDYAYANIKNEEFKHKVKQLNINFPNIKEAIILNSNQRLKEILPELQSPLCKINAILAEVLDVTNFENVRNAVDFFKQNGITTAYENLLKK